MGFSVFVAAGMGIYQERLFSRFGRHAQEGIFYSHALPLPGFLLVLDSIITHFYVYTASDYIASSSLQYDFPIPKLWGLMIGNVITYLVCSSSVFSLITVCSSLTVTLVLTIRKFLSIIFSIYWFDNSFTTLHVVGTALVFSGTLMYLDLGQFVKPVKVGEKEKKL